MVLVDNVCLFEEYLIISWKHQEDQNIAEVTSTLRHEFAQNLAGRWKVHMHLSFRSKEMGSVYTENCSFASAVRRTVGTFTPVWN